MKKIIFIAESIDKNDSSCSKCNVAMIQNLKATGFDVIVYHYTRRPIELEGIDCRSIKEIKYSLNYVLSRIQRLLKRNFNIEMHQILEKIFGFSFTLYNDVNSIKKVVNEILDLNPDLIVTVSKGTSFRPHYAMLSFPNAQHKWLANIHDPYPFHFNPRPYNWVEPGYAKKEKWFRLVSEKAKYSSFPSQLLKDWMGSYFPCFLESGIIIPHQITEYHMDKVQLPSFFNASNFTLLHAGNLMPQRSPKGLLEGYLLFLENNPEAKSNSNLLMLGPTHSYGPMLEHYANQYTSIHAIAKQVNFDVIYALQQQVAVNIILESKSEISPFLPGKFPHCVEANKPILLLAPYYSETRRLFGNDYQNWAEIDEIPKIAYLIEKMYKQWNSDKNSFLLNRTDLIEYCSKEFLKRTIDNIEQNETKI
jgi:hypothetical protein